MKVTIIYFSPSGNTEAVAKKMANVLEQNDSEVQLINISGSKEIFVDKDYIGFLKKYVKAHDLLFVGSPVYAHNIQYHMLELLRKLPVADGKFWSKEVIPFVTYGGISSGIALEQAASTLKITKRKVIAGIKISASHQMIAAIRGREYNHQRPQAELDFLLSQMMDLIRDKKNYALEDKSGLLKYQPFTEKLKIRLIFDEKTWHKKRYPKITINYEKCSQCGECTENCPVLHLTLNLEEVVLNPNSECIHCMNCLTNCNSGAIELIGDLEKGKKFMEKIIRDKGNSEKPATYLYA
jgi:ferredoxin/flavodoxin